MITKCSSFEISIRGIVQGVGFRPFIYNLACLYNINGYVMNMGNIVKIKAQGTTKNIFLFLKEIKEKKPTLSIIEEINIKKIILNQKYNSFEILNSSDGNFENSIIPADISICDECISDIFDRNNNHYLYPFTSCINCGPRYTIINKIPYDKKNTTMCFFDFCKNCSLEYRDTKNRRYYAQGISCSSCGPKHNLINKNNQLIIDFDILKKTSELLYKGFIIAIKSDGGYNLICDAKNINTIKILRKRLNRPMQPFAIMCDSIETARIYGNIKPIEYDLLTSKEKPIVICNKIKFKFKELLDEIAPKLHNVGLILPYTGTQVLLFHYLNKYNINSIIDTSANIPGKPMIIENEKAFSYLNKIADYFVTNNRIISNRMDDSVIRIVHRKPLFIRKSRGYTPEILKIPFSSSQNIIGLGAEMNNTIALLNKDSVYLSQHIGNTKHVETNEFHRRTIDKYTKFFKLNPEIYVVDLHPTFNTTKTGIQYSKNNDSALIKIQHHHAHICSLMADNKMPLDSKIIGIALDGIGYGSDNTMWGGEIMECTYCNYIRLGHLKQQPMPGGDKASYYPRKMLLGILATMNDKNKYDAYIDSMNFIHNEYEELEKNIIYSQIKNKFNITYTTSMGRILDSLASLFSLCDERTYEGEPAMKLESYLTNKIKSNSGEILKKENIELEMLLYEEKSKIIFDTTKLFAELVELITKKKYKKLEIAKLSMEIIVNAISKMALNTTLDTGIKIVGITGGVANNDYIVTSISNILKKQNIKVLTHKRVPSGDGGISFGQVVHAAAANQKTI